ncbi:hypothetical protein DHL47_02775 [Streptococcus panodentis]|uniref:Uncharacterized protein n=1 Tax=Streptococcus panodentis TaxID=1581472 RepID=A0ABS5AUM1_9STRE|nr:hypothetical protein [Streptococcus panodentis]
MGFFLCLEKLIFLKIKVETESFCPASMKLHCFLLSSLIFIEQDCHCSSFLKVSFEGEKMTVGGK